jgi:hypothetical protein
MRRPLAVLPHPGFARGRLRSDRREPDRTEEDRAVDILAAGNRRYHPGSPGMSRRNGIAHRSRLVRADPAAGVTLLRPATPPDRRMLHSPGQMADPAYYRAEYGSETVRPRSSMTIVERSSPPQPGATHSGSPRRRATIILAVLVAVLVVAVASAPSMRERLSIWRQPADVPMATAVIDARRADDPELLPTRQPPSSDSPGKTGAGPVSAWGYIWPTTGYITQEFGCTDFSLEPWNAALGCRFHYGIDIGNVAGTPILAPVSGRVVDVGWREEDGYGYRVVLDDGNGVRILFAHMCCPPDVAVGDEVERGEQIGLMGTTGASSGSHLHLAIEVNGTAIDPRGYLPDGAPDT